MKVILYLKSKFMTSTLNISCSMNKSVFVKIAVFICKYLVPVVLGWLEGDSHFISDSVIGVF